MKFKITTEKGSEIEMEENTEIVIELDNAEYIININKAQVAELIKNK
ncbi:MAG: hypothetical protein KKD77_23760 [Gammaproteobacteria bacterium]|nr:hypothetical protein [Gammaproteobacteria bacterium]